MAGDQALLTGAGTSAGPATGLPLGAAFDAVLLACCFDAARRRAPDVVTPSGLEALRSHRCNLLARLAMRAGHVVVVDILRCFRVIVPTEAQLLAAILADRGVLVLTLNLNDGIEQAHALLRGEIELPPGVPSTYRHAIDRWRRQTPARHPLRVVASGFADADLRRRPVLVRLRGSENAGWHENLLPQPTSGAPKPDADHLGADLLAIMKTATRGHIAIVGVSAADRDCRTSLPPLLRRGSFSWTCATLDAEMVRTLRAIDPDQPTLRPAVEGVRALLDDAGDLPVWPTVGTGLSTFGNCFQRWRTRLPVVAAALTYADTLVDAGQAVEGAALLARLDAIASRRPVEGVPIDVAGHGWRKQMADGQSASHSPADPGG